MNLEDHWMDKYARQVLGYRELDKFVKGQAGLKYYDVPIEMIYAHEREKDRKSMEEWERKEQERKESRNALLELRTEEEVRGNGHTDNNNYNEFSMEIPDELVKEVYKVAEKIHDAAVNKFPTNLTAICKQCDKHTIFCKCHDHGDFDNIPPDRRQQQSNEHCDLKKKNGKRSKKKQE